MKGFIALSTPSGADNEDQGIANSLTFALDSMLYHQMKGESYPQDSDLQSLHFAMAAEYRQIAYILLDKLQAKKRKQFPQQTLRKMEVGTGWERWLN